MVQQSVFSGVMTAIITPFHKDFSIDMPAFHKTIELQKNNGINGIVVLGTTGESPTLSESESEQLVSAALEHASSSFHIYVGTGSNHTQNTIEKSKKYAKFKNTHGKSPMGLMVVTPYYNKPSQQGLEAHYKTLANTVDLPIILYNVPGRTACDMQPETTAILAKEHNVIAIKEAVPDETRLKKLVELCPDDFNLLSGDDATFLDFYKLGGHGVISVSCNVAARQIAQVCNFAKDKDWDKCDKINQKLELLHKNLFVCSNPVPVKWAMYYLGLITEPDCRLPLLAMEGQYQDQVIKALELAGLKKI